MNNSSAIRKDPHKNREIANAEYRIRRFEFLPRNVQDAHQNSSAASRAQTMTPPNNNAFTTSGALYLAVVSLTSLKLPDAKAQDSPTSPASFPASATLLRKTTLNHTAQKSKRARFKKRTWFTASPLGQHRVHRQWTSMNHVRDGWSTITFRPA